MKEDGTQTRTAKQRNIYPMEVNNNNISAGNSNVNGNGNGSSAFKYQPEIQSMMYTSGDVRNPLPEVTQLMEYIVKTQVIELVK